VIDAFKTEICAKLEEYNRNIEGLKSEIEDYTESAENIRKEIGALNSTPMHVSCNTKCAISGAPILSGPFYVFSSGYAILADVLMKHVLPHLSESQRQRAKTLHDWLEQNPSAPVSERDFKQAEFDGLIAAGEEYAPPSSICESGLPCLSNTNHSLELRCILQSIWLHLFRPHRVPVDWRAHDPVNRPTTDLPRCRHSKLASVRQRLPETSTAAPVYRTRPRLGVLQRHLPPYFRNFTSVRFDKKQQTERLARLSFFEKRDVFPRSGPRGILSSRAAQPQVSLEPLA
jgi:hypothetical protein